MTRGQIRRARNREVAWTVLGLLLLLGTWRAWVEIEAPSTPLDRATGVDSGRSAR